MAKAEATVEELVSKIERGDRQERNRQTQGAAAQDQVIAAGSRPAWMGQPNAWPANKIAHDDG